MLQPTFTMMYRISPVGGCFNPAGVVRWIPWPEGHATVVSFNPAGDSMNSMA
ncbi:hypothetical protein [Alteromonas sp. M12]|uniref:hypothetical protein n=1 Tax=Alteromonas sp. M12 TaxID=3135644 RepID=UPI00319EA49A